MVDSTKKILVGMSAVGMAFFVYFEFFQSGGEDLDTSGWIDPATMDNTPSKQEIYALKRKKERNEFNFDRKVNNLDNFLENQIEKTPFPEVDTLHKMEFPLEEDKPERKESPPKQLKNQTAQRGVPVEEKDLIPVMVEKPRRIGFASGGGVENQIVTTGSDGINVLSVVQDNVKITSGSTLKLRTIESFEINSVLVPANTFIVGQTRFSQDRIMIDVESLTSNGRLIKVDLTAYDLHGNQGIYVEGGLESEIQGDALEQTVSELQRNVKVPILRNVPFNSARKKIREPEIPIPAGYKVYLRNL